jgi:predicted negative regulator of RcsB-dependent stress response
MAEVKSKPTPAKPTPLSEAAASSFGSQFLDDTQGWLQDNMRPILYVAGGVLAIVGAVVGYRAYTHEQNKTAQQEMFGAVYAFETDSLNKALKGDGNMIGLETIADEYGGTQAGKLANFYIGSIYLRQGKYDQAIQAFENFSSDDILVQARAYCLEGDAYVEKSDYQQAEYYYLKASNYKPNRFFTPTYLMKLAQVYELHKNPKAAIETYDRLIKEYYESQETADARKNKARLESQVAGS